MTAFVGAIASGCRRRSRVTGGETAETVAELQRYVLGGYDLPASENKLSAKLSEMSHRLRNLEAELTIGLSAVEASKLFAPERLATEAGIARSIEDAHRLRSLDKWYFAEAERQILEFDTWALSEFGRSLGEQPRMQAETRELLEKAIAVHEAISRLLAFVQWAQPRLDEAGTLLFGTPAEAGRYTLMLEEIERRSTMLEARQAQILQSRQQATQQGLSYLAH